MFWQKSKPVGNEGMGLAEKVATEAEGFYRSKKMHCAEAVLLAVKNNFRPEVPDSVIEVAIGFGGGSGTGCLCGAVVGGTMAFGLVIPHDQKRVNKLTQELHHWFKSQYGAVCCRTVRANHKGICAELTGAVAGKVAELLS
ncbi:C-GCAxxG-C-C family protein [Geomobilimonas luticola]|uniref:C-GCAxxG-C-C family protein n=1 Tax=Geomobilimonas luticola TaxID=1114878 RepID=A0ABS5S9Z0_9BACT|nr:C-GCAxxG-C-C family protein [Geomobilimonas luticola]MBT0652189.1 C-GCAxxG-C-C family protein [Geomobilimonas luticola]